MDSPSIAKIHKYCDSRAYTQRLYDPRSSHQSSDPLHSSSSGYRRSPTRAAMFDSTFHALWFPSGTCRYVQKLGSSSSSSTSVSPASLLSSADGQDHVEGAGNTDVVEHDTRGESATEGASHVKVSCWFADMSPTSILVAETPIDSSDNAGSMMLLTSSQMESVRTNLEPPEGA